MKIFNSVSDLQAASLTAGQLTQTKRYFAGQDGGGATYLIKTAVDYGTTPDGYVDHALAGGNIAVLQIEGSLNVKQCGADPTNTLDSTAAIQAALDSFDGVLYFPKGTYIISSGFDIDIHTSTIKGDSATINAQSATGAIFTLYSSVSYGIRYKNFDKVALEGLSIKGTKTVGNYAVVVGKTGNAESNDIVIKRCGFSGFERHVSFTDNAWRTKFVECGFEAPCDYPFYFANPTNAGEVIEFDHCWMVDWTVGPYAQNGNWLFTGCSFIGGATTPMTFVSNAKADFVGCNFEAQTDGGYFLSLDNVAHVKITGGQLYINSSYTQPLIEMLSDSRLTLTGVNLPLYDANSSFETTATYKSRSIIEGIAKHVTAHGCSTDAGDTTNTTIQAILGGATDVYNGTFETGNTNGWALATSGTAGSTFTATTANKRNGSYSGLLACVATGGATATQSISVAGNAGRHFCTGFWARAASGTGVISYPKLQFLSSDGTSIQVLNFRTINGSDVGFIWNAINGTIPDGAATAKIILDGQNLAGGCSINFDDVAFQLI